MFHCMGCALHNSTGTIYIDYGVHGDPQSCVTWWPCTGADLESQKLRCLSPSIKFEVIPLVSAHLCVSAPFLSFIHLLFTFLTCDSAWFPSCSLPTLITFPFQLLPQTIKSLSLLFQILGRENLIGPWLEPYSYSVLKLWTPPQLLSFHTVSNLSAISILSSAVTLYPNLATSHGHHCYCPGPTHFPFVQIISINTLLTMPPISTIVPLPSILNKQLECAQRFTYKSDHILKPCQGPFLIRGKAKVCTMAFKFLSFCFSICSSFHWLSSCHIGSSMFLSTAGTLFSQGFSIYCTHCLEFSSSRSQVFCRFFLMYYLQAFPGSLGAVTSLPSFLITFCCCSCFLQQLLIYYVFNLHIFMYCLCSLLESKLHKGKSFVYFVFLAPRSVPGFIKYALNEQMNESKKRNK